MDYYSILEKFKAGEPLKREELEALLSWMHTNRGRHLTEKEILKEWNAFESSETYDYKSLLIKLNHKIDELPARRARKILIPKYIRYTMEAAAIMLLVIGITFSTRTQVEEGEAFCKATEPPFVVPPSCTIQMGQGNSFCVRTCLEDTSVMPTLISGNTYVASGERQRICRPCSQCNIYKILHENEVRMPTQDKN